MARTPARRGERKMIAVGSVWGNGSTTVTVRKVTQYGDYRYVTYRIDGRKTDEQPIDDHTFALRYDAKVVHKSEIKVTAQVIKAEDESGKTRNVTWA